MTSPVDTAVAEAIEEVAAGQTALMVKVDGLASFQAANASWRDHYGRKLDQLWKVLYENGFITRVAVLETRVDGIDVAAKDRREDDRERTDIKVQAVKEGAIDWKWLLSVVSPIATGVAVYLLTH